MILEVQGSGIPGRIDWIRPTVKSWSGGRRTGGESACGTLDVSLKLSFIVFVENYLTINRPHN